MHRQACKTDQQTGRHRERQTGMQTYRQVDRLNRQAGKADQQTGRQRGRQTDKTDRMARQTNSQAKR